MGILFLALTLCSVSTSVSSCSWFWFQVPLADLSPSTVSEPDTLLEDLLPAEGRPNAAGSSVPDQGKTPVKLI